METKTHAAVAGKQGKQHWLALMPDAPLPAGFPLGIASNGQFIKQFGGRRHTFGSVRLGWQSGLACYERDWPYITAGQEPPERREGYDVADPDHVRLHEIANPFLSRELERTKAGAPDQRPLAKTTFVEIRNTIEVAVTHLGRDCVVDGLTPDDFGRLRGALGRQWRCDRMPTRKWVAMPASVGVDKLKRRIGHVRAMFRWAGPGENGQSILGSFPRYGDKFKPVSIRAIHTARREKERLHGPKLLPVAQLPHVLGACDKQLKAMFLLGLLCGFSEIDCAKLYDRAVDFGSSIVDYDRIKTLTHRRVFMVPLLADAIRDARAVRPHPASRGAVAYERPGSTPIMMDDLVFVTERGELFADLQTADLDGDGVPDVPRHYSRLSRRFDTVLRNLDKQFPDGVGGLTFKRPRVSFGSLRHTFETCVQRYGDKNLADFVMGHSKLTDISSHYDHILDHHVQRIGWYAYDHLLGERASDEPVGHGRGVGRTPPAPTDRPRLRLVGG